MTAPTLTLTEHELRARCAELDGRIAEKREAYDAAALARARGEGDPKLAYDLRSDLVTLEVERMDLDAAWRAAQREHELQETEAGRERRREGYEAASQHLANAARLVAEIEATCLRLGDFVEEAVDEDQAARRSVVMLLSKRERGTLSQRLVFERFGLDELLAAVADRFGGKQSALPVVATRASALADRYRKQFARQLTQDITQDNDDEVEQ